MNNKFVFNGSALSLPSLDRPSASIEVEPASPPPNNSIETDMESFLTAPPPFRIPPPVGYIDPELLQEAFAYCESIEKDMEQ